MPENIESRTFRRAARRNCIEYLGLLIYTTSTPALRSHTFPTFRTQNPNGAVSQLFATLVNMNSQIEQIRKGLRMADAHPVPGVSWDDAGGISMNLSGAMYFENASQYVAFQKLANDLSRIYGWVQNTSEKMGAAVYRPAMNDFTNVDPAQAAVKGMVMGAASEAMDSFTVFSATDAIEKGSEAEKKYFAARDRLNGGSTFSTMAIQYYANSPLTIQTHWQNAAVPRLLVENQEVFTANVGYLPTSLSITPRAFVQDSTGLYPTYVELSVSLSNPLGGILANFSNGNNSDPANSAGAVIPATYLKDVVGVNY